MKILIAVICCHKRRDWSDLARATWATVVPSSADVRFFFGRGASKVTLKEDVVLDCDDSYQKLPEKVQTIVRWALSNGYDYMLKCDDDVILNPEALLASGFDHADFTGHECAPKNQTPWGFNYWLSQKAMKIVAGAVLPSDNNDEAWVSRNMNANGILLNHDERYFMHYGHHLKDHSNNRRSLRKPQEPPVHVGRYFSWCIHCKEVSKEVLFEEYKRIFTREVKTQCDRSAIRLVP